LGKFQGSNAAAIADIERHSVAVDAQLEYQNLKMNVTRFRKNRNACDESVNSRQPSSHTILGDLNFALRLQLSPTRRRAGQPGVHAALGKVVFLRAPTVPSAKRADADVRADAQSEYRSGIHLPPV
jgi:hypothetical protein